MRRSSVLNRASIVGLFGGGIGGIAGGEEGEAAGAGAVSTGELRELKLKLARAERENKELRD